ncbi:MAG: hypothetical protein F6K57_37915 [Moorea sp. SIO4A5]|nr:hypothetical protein [Moorena sp. SIO4A5]
MRSFFFAVRTSGNLDLFRYPHATTLYSQQKEGLIAIAARTTPSFL